MRHIDLRLPRGWNQCTTAELEQIAQVTLDCQSRVDRYHPFDPQQVKLALFFLFTHLTILGQGEDEKGNTYYEVIRDCDKPKRRFLPLSFGEGRGGVSSFPLFLWQINYWINGESGLPKDNKKKVKPGILDWLNADNPKGLTNFPYPEIRLHKTREFSIFNFQFSIRSWGSKPFASPGPAFSTASYEQYRIAQDYMQLYTILQNKLLQAQKAAKKATVPDASVLTIAKQLNQARAKFLATIFLAKVDYIDSHTGMPKHDYHYASSQTQENYPYFLSFPDTKFQVILFWWSGIMRLFSSKFPHIFKVSKVENKTIVSPLDVYTNTIASLQKYTSQTEESLNTQLHTVTLKDLDNMVHEAEEIEKASKKHK